MELVITSLNTYFTVIDSAKVHWLLYIQPFLQLLEVFQLSSDVVQNVLDFLLLDLTLSWNYLNVF